jgi:hypothetical protein
MPAGSRRRALDLMALRAVEGLDPAGRAELDRLTRDDPGLDPDALERVAASLAVAGLQIEPMPPRLRDRVEAQARALLDPRVGS